MSDKEAAWSGAMRAARLGDSRAYESFLKDLAASQRRIVGWYALRLGLNAGNLEDVVQEILLAVHAKRHHWDDRRPLVPWVNAIARYKMIDATRQMRRDARCRIHLADEEWAAIFADEQMPGDRSGADMERLLSTLPSGQQSITRAIGIEGESPREVALRLGMSEGAVRVAFHRSLKKLMALAGESTKR